MKSYKKINNKIDIDIIVPVKTLSERVKNKNLRKFANTSLYELKLKQLSKTKQFKKIIISSESQHVLNVAKKYNFSTHLRDKRLSTSHVPRRPMNQNGRVNDKSKNQKKRKKLFKLGWFLRCSIIHKRIFFR